MQLRRSIMLNSKWVRLEIFYTTMLIRLCTLFPGSLAFLFSHGGSREALWTSGWLRTNGTIGRNKPSLYQSLSAVRCWFNSNISVLFPQKRLHEWVQSSLYCCRSCKIYLFVVLVFFDRSVWPCLIILCSCFNIFLFQFQTFRKVGWFQDDFSFKMWHLWSFAILFLARVPFSSKTIVGVDLNHVQFFVGKRTNHGCRAEFC